MGDPAALDIGRDGACLHRGLATALLNDLAAVLAKWPDGHAGVRISGDADLARLLDTDGPIGAMAAKVRGCDVRPVRAVLFDKNERTDWALGWHQDRTIAVREQAEVTGFGPWSVKQGIRHVEPPFSVIEGMVTVRIHLDPVDENNAPLLVALGSHLLGRIPVSEVDAVVAGLPVRTCLAEVGDVWFYRTPILHASNAVVVKAGAGHRRRRVLQVDYAAGGLPAPLEWLGI
ncbi:phytanoyl-CoA dioxygenase [Novosphingobium sp. KA1]|uniref:phytanoyl-CoA dioxygenase n=1 Tax=Novosphingobium sp. (strain KA1) TaxID=164608 RepID=UPI001F5E1E23|nr:phytanoyl-CoA dioxygenase [Novosphingobium sp. KA1]